MNQIRRIYENDLEAIVGGAADGLDVGVYEMFRSEPDDQHDEPWIDLIPTGGLSVNCQCLVVAATREEARRLLDETDPEASGCGDEHLWLPTADSPERCGCGSHGDPDEAISGSCNDMRWISDVLADLCPTCQGDPSLNCPDCAGRGADLIDEDELDG